MKIDALWYGIPYQSVGVTTTHTAAQAKNKKQKAKAPYGLLKSQAILRWLRQEDQKRVLQGQIQEEAPSDSGNFVSGVSTLKVSKSTLRVAQKLRFLRSLR